MGHIGRCWPGTALFEPGEGLFSAHLLSSLDGGTRLKTPRRR